MTTPDDPRHPEPFSILETLDSHDVQFLDDRIYEYNVHRTGIADGRLLAIVLRDSDQNIIAGLYGWTWGRCCEVKYLWVHEQWRGQQLGTHLMTAAEAEARRRGAAQMVLSTHDFQAPDFYRGLGFEPVGQIDDYPEGHQSIFLRKRLLRRVDRKDGPMATNTIRLHRVLHAPPERVYRAFLDADAMAKWLPPNGFTGKVHHLDPKVGGSHRMSFTNFTTGHSHSFGGTYLELVPHERIRYTDIFDDPKLPGEMQVTVSLRKVSVGTELAIVQEGVPDVIPPDACYLGWQESLTLLGKLVEAEIPD